MNERERYFSATLCIICFMLHFKNTKHYLKHIYYFAQNCLCLVDQACIWQMYPISFWNVHTRSLNYSLKYNKYNFLFTEVLTILIIYAVFP